MSQMSYYRKMFYFNVQSDDSTHFSLNNAEIILNYG